MPDSPTNPDDQATDLLSLRCPSCQKMISVPMQEEVRCPACHRRLRLDFSPLVPSDDPPAVVPDPPPAQPLVDFVDLTCPACRKTVHVPSMPGVRCPSCKSPLQVDPPQPDPPAPAKPPSTMSVIEEVCSVVGALLACAAAVIAVFIGFVLLMKADQQAGTLGMAIVGLLEAIAVLLLLIYRRLPPPPKPPPG